MERTMTSERIETVVIGGGPAGLATGYIGGQQRPTRSAEKVLA